ncbi:crustacean CHH/MIH/GIH neurohormone family domain-containing protein [Ditylenchus destructor]|nr:crustacean CHH/MIH/GIH neurohormone family domain-containing protein [Ditylenchus destructor]
MAKAVESVPQNEEEPVAIIVGDNETPAAAEEPTAMEDKTATTKWRFNPKTCNIYENEPLHAIMDRVCELCHDMYSHQNPNMRVECRSDCFRSENFKKCLRLFKPSRTLRRNPKKTRQS